MSKKAWTLIIMAILVLLLGIIWTSRRQYQAAEIEKCRRNLQEHQFKATRLYAAKVLEQMGPAARPAVPDLIKALQDEDWQVRRMASLALGKIGPDPNAIPAMAACLKDPNPFVRMRTAEALGSMGPAAEQALPALEAALAEDQQMSGERNSIEEAIDKIRGKAQP